MLTPRQRKAEQVVIDHIRECGGIISYWWPEDNKMRQAAWRRLEMSGRISVKVIGYPNWRVTINEGNEQETKGIEQ